MKQKVPVASVVVVERSSYLDMWDRTVDSYADAGDFCWKFSRVIALVSGHGLMYHLRQF